MQRGILLMLHGLSLEHWEKLKMDKEMGCGVVGTKGRSVTGHKGRKRK